MQSQAMRSRQDMFHMKHVPWMLMLLSLYASTSSSLHTEDGHTAEMEFTQQQNPALRHKQLQADKKPWFCHNYDCPPYKVLNTSTKYETRLYEKGSWVATTVPSYSFPTAVGIGLKRLYDYTAGENADRTQIPLTVPVFTGANATRALGSKANFTIGLYIPSQFQAAVPKPLNPDVWITEVSEGTAYVLQFGGYLVDDITLQRKAKELKDALAAGGESFAAELCYAATYDPLSRIWSRHNEVMYSRK